MIIFQEEFAKSGSRTILYQGKILHLAHRFPLTGASSIVQYKTVELNSPYEQGVSFDVERSGTIVHDGKQIPKGKLLRVWVNAATQFTLRVSSRDSFMWVYNHYVNWRGDVDHWNMGCAMYVEEIPGGFRYHCNDGDPDDDLNDLVFELTVIGVEEEPSSKRRTRKQSKS